MTGTLAAQALAFRPELVAWCPLLLDVLLMIASGTSPGEAAR
jgi:hypothetical protein